MSILYEILIATVFSALLSPQTEVKEQEPNKVKTEQVSEKETEECEMKEVV